MPIYNFNEFFDQLPVYEYSFTLDERVQSSRAVSGVITRVENGPRLWGGTVVLSTQSHDKARRSEALIQVMQRPGNLFLIHPKKDIRPASGDVTSNAGVTISNAAASSCRISGLPANARLTAGDCFSYLHNNINRFHQIAFDVTANGAGVADVQLVHPFAFSTNPADGTALTVIKPRITAMIIPGSFKTGTVGLAATGGGSFDFIQAIKV
ncbi:hypothetical protein [Paracoccus sp. (in: a-proteobacteria)]|uniref:hypothetical protein n=1 Tax=Paracoccus sp. TaxID=267 RepID=UPI004059710C